MRGAEKHLPVLVELDVVQVRRLDELNPFEGSFADESARPPDFAHEGSGNEKVFNMAVPTTILAGLHPIETTLPFRRF